MIPSRASRPGRNRDLAKIHIAAQQLGLDDSTYRDMLWSIGRVRSAGQLDAAGREAVLEHLRSCGFHDAHPRTKRRYPPGSQAAKILHLWISLAEAGAIHDSSDRALRVFVLRQSAQHDPSGHGWDAPNLLPASVASQIIEHLKRWLARVSH